MLPPVEHAQKQLVTLTCFVKDFFPQEVFVSWRVDDDPVTANSFTTYPKQSNGAFSAYSQLSINLEQWKKKDEVYSCAVYHESVANTTYTIVRSIMYNTLQHNNMVNLNMNVPLSCKAE